MNLTKWTTATILAIFLAGATVALGLAGYRTLDGRQPAAPLQASLAGAQPPAQDKAKQAQKPDAQRIIGIWRITKGVGDGKDLPADFTTLSRLEFTKDGALIMHAVDQQSAGKYKLGGPGKIDIAIRPNEPLAPGIYKFDGGDRLTICTGKEAGGKRPTELTADKDSSQVLFVLARAKPGEEKPTPDEIAKFANPVARIREAAARTLSATHLKQIGAAMASYDKGHKALPLSAIYSKDGKTPLLSWRVALLPYLDQQALYTEFKLDEPWDSKHNKPLIAKMPQIYQIPIGAQEGGLTYYQVFTGPATLFVGTIRVALKGIADRSMTLLVVEATDPVIWTKPGDLTLPKEKDKLPAVGGLFKNGFHVLMCDGTVHMMARTVQPALLRSLVELKKRD